MPSVLRSASRRLVAVGAVLLMLAGATPADAFSSDGLLLYLDARSTSSYPGTGAAWSDLSPNGVDGTLKGSSLPTFDATERTFGFPGGPNGTSYVELDANLRDFGSGISIEFEAEFGATLSEWEQIFSFGPGVGAAVDDIIFVGHLRTRRELVLELFDGGTRVGRCHTATGRTALSDDRSYAVWLITVGRDDPTDTGEIPKCRIYKDGVALRTNNLDGTDPDSLADTYFDSGDADGSDFGLPRLADRRSNFLGRSNFSAVSDFEGSIRYLRIYDRALTPAEALANATSDPNAVAQPVAAVSRLALACAPDVVPVGGTVTCEVSGGDPNIDIQWRASYDPTFADAGVTLDAQGAGSFSFVAPVAALGQPVTVELVEWDRTDVVEVGGPVPASVPAGEGRGGPALPAVAGLLLAVVTAGGLRLRRSRSTA